MAAAWFMNDRRVHAILGNVADQILRAKIRIPKPLPGLLPRPALLSKLKACLGSPLVLVSAPAGFGKTSIAAQYLEALSAVLLGAADPSPPPRAAWVSLEREDDDPVRFWGAAAAALELAAAESAEISPFAPLLSAARAPQPPSARELATALVEAVDSLDSSFLLVLDDFQLISSREILDSFTRFVERPPERLRILLLSRRDPPLPLARLRAGGIMAELRADDLRFGPSEAASLLLGAAGGRLSPEQARELADKTEGWGAGLRLASLSLGRKLDVEAFIKSFSGSDRLILEYLIEEVLGLQAEETRSFLLRSAVLDRFCAELCDAAIGPAGGSAAMIGWIETAGLFLVPLDDEGRWYRYHHLFAETLRARLRALAPGVEAELLAKAAAWHESSGNPETALELHLRAGNKAEAARVLEGIDFLRRGELATLDRHLEAVGEAEIRKRARLDDLAAWVRFFQGRIPEAESWMAKTAGDIDRFGGKEGAYLRGSHAALRAFILLLRGRTPEAAVEAKAAEADLAPGDYYPLGVAFFAHGVALRADGRFEAARAEFERFRALGETYDSPWSVAVARYELGTTAALAGRLGEATRLFEGALADAARGKAPFGSVAKLRAAYADLLYERGEVERAESQAAEALAATQPGGNPNTGLEVYAIHIRLLLFRRELEEADRFLERAAELEGRGGILPRLEASIRELRARAALLAGSADPSPLPIPDRWLEDAAAMGTARSCEIRRLLARGNPGEALALARSLAEEAAAGGWGRLFVIAKAQEALAFAGAGREEEAFAALGQSIEAGLPEGFFRGYLDLGGDLRRLLSAFVRRRGGSEAASGFAARLLAARDIQADEAAEPALAGVLSAREREVVVLLSEGLSNRAMAERLFVSESTVKTHLYHIAAKLEAPNRVAILARSRELGLT